MSYNKTINRVYLCIENQGIYWFIPGKENNIIMQNCFGFNISLDSKAGMVFNGVQGILRNGMEMLYCSNLLEDKESIKLCNRDCYVSQVVFLNNKEITILDKFKRKLIIMDLQNNSVISEKVIHYKGRALAMSISEGKKRMLAVAVMSPDKDSVHYPWAYVYMYRILLGPNL